MTEEMTSNAPELEAAVEALLFAFGTSVEKPVLMEACGVERDELERALEALEEKYSSEHSGLKLIRLEDGVQLGTRPELYEYIEKALHTGKKSRLSDSALETLSIVAYRQPVTRSQIERIRGVNSDRALNRLIELDLVKELGRLNAPGRPLLFGTTLTFLRCFGVSSIGELPEPDPAHLEKFREQAEAEAASGETEEDDGGSHVELGV